MMDTEERIAKMLKKTEIFFKHDDSKETDYDRLVKELKEYRKNLESRIKRKES